VTKLWNAARFIAMHAPVQPDRPQAAPTLTDRLLLHQLGSVVEQATEALDSYELFTARSAVERFFWSDLCDTYLELVKRRLTADEESAGYHAAVQTLRRTFLVTLKLFAPFLPHVTEAIYLRDFAQEEGAASIHLAGWPVGAACPADPEAAHAGAAMSTVVDAVRHWKAEHKLSVGAPLARLAIGGRPQQLTWLAAMTEDLGSITRAAEIRLVAGDSLSVTINDAVADG
jgi:valyl-tRNA synthetase